MSHKSSTHDGQIRIITSCTRSMTLQKRLKQYAVTPNIGVEWVAYIPGFGNVVQG